MLILPKVREKKMAITQTVLYSPSQSSSVVLYPGDALLTKSLPVTILSCISKSENLNKYMFSLNFPNILVFALAIST